MKLEIQNLQVSLQNSPVLRCLSLSVQEGEFLSLLGPSGCGKSTLLKTVAGLLPMDEGRLLLDGQDISNLPTHKRGAVIVFQDIRLFPNMSVAENVAFPLKMQGVAKAERLRRAEELLECVRLGGLGKRRASQLSGGQQQRVALARALASQPRLLLLDEPFSSLDENLRADMRSLVLELHRQFGMTTLMVTHDREEALSMSDRVAVMLHGQIEQVAAPRDILAAPATPAVADYFGGGMYLSASVRNGTLVLDESTQANLPDGEYGFYLRSMNILP